MGSYPNDPRYGGPASMPGVPQRPGVAPATIPQDHKWPALRFIAVLLRIIAWIELVLGIILALATGATGFASGSLLANSPVKNIGGTGLIAALIAALFVLIGAVLGFIWTYASAEIIMIFITIEKNTRKY